MPQKIKSSTTECAYNKNKLKKQKIEKHFAISNKSAKNNMKNYITKLESRWSASPWLKTDV